MTKSILLISACAMMLMACQKTIDPIDEDSMRFDFRLPGATKATGTSFDAKDVVGLFGVTYDGDAQQPLQISGNWINNESLTYDGSQWTPARKIVWPDEKIDIYAYYPYNKDLQSVDEQSFSVQLDQNTERQDDQLGGYEQSDLLWASKVAVQKTSDTPSPVTLSFSHVCSKVIVKLVKGEFYSGTLPDDAQLYIHNTVPTGIVNLAQGSISKDMYAGAESIKCKKIAPSNSDELPSFEAIVIPQRVTSKRPFIELVAGKTSYLVEQSFNLKPGYCTVYTLTLSNSPDQIIINIGGTIEGWNE